MRFGWPVLGAAILLLAGCAVDRSNPREVLLHTLAAFYQNDLEEVYAHLSSDDRSYWSLERFVRDNTDEDSILVGPLMKRTTFEIESIEIHGPGLRATAVIQQPNLQAILEDLMGSAFQAMASGMQPEHFDELIEQRYRKQPIPMMTIKRGFGLVHERDGWRVWLCLRHELRIAELLLEANQLVSEKRLGDAVARLREALALNPNRIELSGQITALENLITPNEEAVWDPQREIFRPRNPSRS